jgi:hypothetical protein
MYDPRAGSDPIKQADAHGGIKGSRVVWLGDRVLEDVGQTDDPLGYGDVEADLDGEYR